MAQPTAPLSSEFVGTPAPSTAPRAHRPPAPPAGADAARDACVYDEQLRAADAALLVARVLRSLTAHTFARALVVQCGGGRLATQLAADEVVGLDDVRALLGRAQKRVAAMADRARFCFASEPFDAEARLGAQFDLIVLDGLRRPLAVTGGSAPLRLAVLRHLTGDGHLVELCGDDAPLLSLPFAHLRTETFAIGQRTVRLRHTVRTLPAADADPSCPQPPGARR